MNHAFSHILRGALCATLLVSYALPSVSMAANKNKDIFWTPGAFAHTSGAELSTSRLKNCIQNRWSSAHVQVVELTMQGRIDPVKGIGSMTDAMAPAPFQRGISEGPYFTAKLIVSRHGNKYPASCKADVNQGSNYGTGASIEVFDCDVQIPGDDKTELELKDIACTDAEINAYQRP